MPIRNVPKSFTFERQRQEINLIGDDVGNRENIDTLSTDGQASVIGAVNEIIATPSDDLFIDEVSTSNTLEQRMLFADNTNFISGGTALEADSFTSGQSFDEIKEPSTNPSDLDFSTVKYDYGGGNDTAQSTDRFTYNASTRVLRVNNVKTDIRNRNDDTTVTSPGQTVLSTKTDYQSDTPSQTSLYVGRLKTKLQNSPIDIQQRLLKIQDNAQIALEEGSAIGLATGIDTGAYVNVTNNKKIIYVSANDENASDVPDNDGANINRPFKSIERALIEAAKRSYVGPGQGIEDNQTPPEPGIDLFENFTILLFPGEYIIDNTPGLKDDGTPFLAADIAEETATASGEAYETSASYADEFKKFNSPQGGLIVPRGTSIVGLDLRKTLIRPKYVPDPADDTIGRAALFRVTGACYIWQFTIKDNPTNEYSHHKLTAFEYANYDQLEDYYRKIDKYSRFDDGEYGYNADPSIIEARSRFFDSERLLLDNREFIARLAVARVTLEGSTQLDENLGNTTAEGDTVGQACVDDTILLIEKIAYNLAYGGNDRVVAAAQLYVDSPSGTIEGEEDDSIAVWTQANALCNEIVTNVLVDTSAWDSLDITQQNNISPSGLGTQIRDLTITADQNLATNGGVTEDIDGISLANPDNTLASNCSDVRSAIDVFWDILEGTAISIRDDATPQVENTAGDPVVSTAPTDAEDYNQRVEENRIVGFVQNKYLSDTVASASPYVFNISLRSVWGICGLLADGAQSTGLRSMVLAQYTGISLQRDDRAFILNGVTTDQVEDPDERHTNSLSEYRDDWRHFHIKSTNNGFLQIVSVFAVGQADHFVTETGGDHSITNSNSNFGNTSLIATSHRTEIFKQDNGAFVVGLVPPRGIDPDSESNINIYDIDFGATLAEFGTLERAGNSGNFKKIYVKVDGESLIKESDIPEFYADLDNTDTGTAELLVDDVNYLFGKRRYADTNPEAIYARLPKNYEDSSLRTFAARLRANGYIPSTTSGNILDPKDSYGEGVIDTFSVNAAGAPAVESLKRPIKNFRVLDPADDAVAEASAADLPNMAVFTNTGTFPGSVSTGLNTSARFKTIVAGGGAYEVYILESPITDVAAEGNADTSGITEVTKVTAISGGAGAGQVQYTYVPGGSGLGSGTNAIFEIYRIPGVTPYVIKIVTAGINYEPGDSFTIPGSALGGIDGEPGDPTPGNNLTIHVTAVENSGDGYSRGDEFRVAFTDTSTDPDEVFDFRVAVKDPVTPLNVELFVNDLYTYNTLSNADYTPAKGFDAEFSLGISGSGPNPWDDIGQVTTGVGFSLIGSTTYIGQLLAGGSGFSTQSSFDSITVPGSYFSIQDAQSDLIITVTGLTGATITTKNFNTGTVDNPQRRFYGWEFARTIDGEYFGRLSLLVDDERVGGTTTIEGVPTKFEDTESTFLFSGFTSDQLGYLGTATTQAGNFQDRTIDSGFAITDNLDGTFTITTQLGIYPKAPFYKGDQISLINTRDTSGTVTLDGTYLISDVTNTDRTVLVINIPSAPALPGGESWDSNFGFVRKISKAVTIPVKLAINGGQGDGSQGLLEAVYPNDWSFADNDGDTIAGTYDDQIANFSNQAFWKSSGSGFSYDDVFVLNTGSGTSLLPESPTPITFQIDDDPAIQAVRDLPGRVYSATAIKEDDYLPGSSLGIRYSSYDESLSLSGNTVSYGDPVANTNLSLLKRITQRIDSNNSGALEADLDNFEFNSSVINTLYMKRLQDNRASNGNSELLWRIICKVPKDGYNNIKLRAPEEKFVIHLKDPGIGFGDQTLDYPFVYDYAEIGKIRKVKVDTSAATTGSATGLTITTAEYKKPKRLTGTTDTYYEYPDITNTLGAETLAPNLSAVTFDVVYGPEVDGKSTSVFTINDPGYGFNFDDRLTLSDGSIVHITQATTTNARSFYVQRVEPVVEYEYNVRDGYYLLTVLDGNVNTLFEPPSTTSDIDNTIVYGKQRLIGLEDLDSDDIAAEVNHRKQDASDLIEKNRLFIQTEAHGYLLNEYPDFYGVGQPGENLNPERCKRDIGYLLNAIINDLRISGNSNILNTAQYYYATGTQEFIESELIETRQTFDYARDLAVLALRNWDTYVEATVAGGSGIVTLPSLDGIVEGMRVYEVSTALPTDAASQTTAESSLTAVGFLSITNEGTNEVTVFTDRTFTTPVSLSGEDTLYLRLEQGLGSDWSTPGTDVPFVDETIIQDYDYATGECADVISTVNTLYTIFDDVLTANSIDITIIAPGNIAQFDAPVGTGAALDDKIVRVFGASIDALNGDDVLLTYSGSGDTYTYDIPVTFQIGTTDKAVFYDNDDGVAFPGNGPVVEFTEPSRSSYYTENVTLEGFGYSQNINYLFPEVDLDNPKWNPKASNTQYRKDVGNAIIRDNTLVSDEYERISQYSITAEATQGVINSILTGGAGSTGLRNRIFGDIDLTTEFGIVGETATREDMETPYVDSDKNVYGVNKSPVLEFDAQNIPIFTERCIVFDTPTPVSFYRPSIIRASSHTWEYVGFGPGNYSTGLPQFQDITLTQQQTVNSQTVERGGGFVASSGTNSEGDFYIGNQVIDAKGNQTNTLNFPRIKTSAENRLIDYTNLDSLAANSSTASFNPSSFSPVLTSSLQAIQEAQRNSFKASNIESSIFTTSTLKINSKISISNNVFEDTNNFPESRQDQYGFTKRASINWFNVDPTEPQYQDLANSFISPTDIADWANAKSLVPSVPVAWNVSYQPSETFDEVTNVGTVDINETFTKSLNFTVQGIDPGDSRWFDPVSDTISIPLGTPEDSINNTNLTNYSGRSGQFYIVFQGSPVKASAIIPQSIWRPVENTWAGVSQVDGSATTFLQGNVFVVSYFITGGQIIYAVNVVES